MSQATVLVTGVNGFIGRHAARRLAADGYRVRGLGRRGDVVDNAELVVGDVADRDAARKALAGVQATVHLAAYFGGEFDGPSASTSTALAPWPKPR